MKKQKKFFLVVTVVLFLLFLSACGGGSSETSSDGNTEESYKLTMNVAYPPSKVDDDVLMNGTKRFAELVEERTDGRVKVDVFYSNQLVPQDQLLDALKTGTVDFGYSGPQYYGDTIPTAFFTNLPFFGKDIDHMMSLIREKGIDKIVDEEMEANGVKLLFYGPTGEYGLMGKKPIRSIDDIKGMSLRAAGGLWTPWYESLGASPVNVAAAEIYEALQRGTVDAVPYPFYTLNDYSYHEVVDSITTPGVIPSAVTASFMSLKTWNKLPEDIQNVITEVSQEIELENVEKYRLVQEKALQFAKENGVEVIELSDEEYNRFVQSSQVVWDEFAKMNDNTKKIVEIMREDME
ncbi:TRAP transporter substrate-binding protein DctP [Mesobacillus maritimus]|uniref:TRAP transporter substrate-binding protein n=1 Tax=Mesobacillus maritimus TaxID=1643336 RepID=UPI00204172F6|nr:TRAP transporter substrate-binding protein DctP [Mesobacillus maritimus]MCM3669366.1 TRAP transporter substrate-binding protein DctP [Mesobacillus maritimus]